MIKLRHPRRFHHGRNWAGIDQPTPSEIKMDDPWAAETKGPRRKEPERKQT